MASRDIIDLLLDDHAEFRTMLQELEMAQPSDRERIFHQLVGALAAHEAAEAAVVHSTTRDQVDGGRGLAESVLEEEHRAERLLAGMEEMDFTSSEFVDATQRLNKEVLEHAEHEEHEEFPLLRESLSIEERTSMGAGFARLKASGPTHPHPKTPQSPEARAAAGPVAGLFDRARDRAREVFASK